MSKIKIGVFKDKFFFFKNTMEISALYFYSNVIYMLKFFENPFSIQKKTNFCTNSTTNNKITNQKYIYYYILFTETQ